MAELPKAKAVGVFGLFIESDFVVAGLPVKSFILSCRRITISNLHFKKALGSFGNISFATMKEFTKEQFSDLIKKLS